MFKHQHDYKSVVALLDIVVRAVSYLASSCFCCVTFLLCVGMALAAASSGFLYVIIVCFVMLGMR